MPLIANDYTTSPEQGAAVAMNSAGDVLAAGGYNNAGGAGAAWIWKYNGTRWNQVRALKCTCIYCTSYHCANPHSLNK